LRIFLGFSYTGVNSGTTVMARQTGRWDRGVRGIPDVVTDRGAGWHAMAMARVRAVPAEFAARTSRGRGRTTGVSKGQMSLAERFCKHV
jgi:hypothetical protein